MTKPSLGEALDTLREFMNAGNFVAPRILEAISVVVEAHEKNALNPKMVMAALNEPPKLEFSPAEFDWLPEDDSDDDLDKPIPFVPALKTSKRKLFDWAKVDPLFTKESNKQYPGYPSGRGCSYRMVDKKGTRLLVGNVIDCKPHFDPQGAAFWDVKIFAVDNSATEDLVTTVIVGNNGVSVDGAARIYGPHPDLPPSTPNSWVEEEVVELKEYITNNPGCTLDQIFHDLGIDPVECEFLMKPLFERGEIRMVNKLLLPTREYVNRYYITDNAGTSWDD